MPHIRPHKDGFRAEVEVQGVRKSKSGFRTRREAIAWSAKREDEIRRSARSGMTFGTAARRWLDVHSNLVCKRNVEQSLRDYALPALDARPLREITRRELVAVVRAVADQGKIETAQRVAQRIGAIFNHAVDLGELDSHPATGLSRVIGTTKVEHMPAVPLSEVGALLRAIDGYPEPVTRLGLLLLAHTFVRTNELIGARWGEFISDPEALTGVVWVVPAERVKKIGNQALPHVVPISPQVLALLNELRAYTGECEFLLQSPRVPGRHVSNNTLLFALYRLGYRGRMTGHGFRSIASTFLNQQGKWPADVIERQLQHGEKDAVRGAYNRAEYLAQRRSLMDFYSGWLSAQIQNTQSAAPQVQAPRQLLRPFFSQLAS